MQVKQTGWKIKFFLRLLRESLLKTVCVSIFLCICEGQLMAFSCCGGGGGAAGVENGSTVSLRATAHCG